MTINSNDENQFESESVESSSDDDLSLNSEAGVESKEPERPDAELKDEEELAK